jgi:outer membrane protein insertion porin family
MRGRAFLAACLLASAVAALAPIAALAQTGPAAFAGRTVASVTLEVDEAPDTTPALLALVSVKAGAPFRLDEEDDTLHRLVSAAGFIEASVVVTPRADGSIDVTFRATPLHPVDRLEFEGDTGLPPGDLNALVTDRLGRLVATVTPDRVRQALIDGLIDEGFRHADADVRVVRRHDPERSTYVFQVAAGPRAQIADLTIQNTSPLSNPTLAERAGVQRGLPYRPRAIDNRVAEIRADLTSRGYYAAQASVVADEREPDRFAVTLTVAAGPHVRLRWAGDPPPKGDLETFVPVARFGSVDDDLLEESRQRIESALKNDGFRNATVVFSKETPAGELIVTFTVTRGPRFLIAGVEIPANLAMTPTELRALLALEVGVPLNLQQVVDGQRRVFDEYHARGFYRADVRFDEFRDQPPTPKGDVPTILPLVVEEGPRAIIRAVEFVRTTTQVPELELRRLATTRENEPYTERKVAADVYALGAAYVDRGFRASSITPKIEFAQDGTAVTVRFEIQEGPLVRVADIQVVGNEQVSEERIREAMTLAVGAPYGEAARVESRARLVRMGVFRRVDIGLQSTLLPGDDRAHVVVTVVEQPATTIGWGPGVEAKESSRVAADGTRRDQLIVSPRGFFEIGRRNLGGRDRSVNFFSRLSLRPREVTATPDTPGSSFSEYRVTFTLRERRAFDTDTDVVVGVTSEQAIRTGYNFLRKGVNVEGLRRLSGGVSVSGLYALDFTKLFDVQIDESERPLVDRLFPQVRLSRLAASLLWDRRDRPLYPRTGTLSTADIEFASRGLGSEIGYAKAFVQSSMYYALTSGGRLVAAVRGQLGMAHGFPRAALDEKGQPIVVEDLPASQRFYAGGSTTVRGFAIDRLGVPEVFDARTGLPKGGNGLVVLNAELRTVVTRLFGRDLAAVQFVDAGNVFAKARDIDLDRLRGAVGFGVRYDSPFGPVRLDFGFKLDRQVLGGTRERGWSYHLNFGEAF